MVRVGVDGCFVDDDIRTDFNSGVSNGGEVLRLKFGRSAFQLSPPLASVPLVSVPPRLRRHSGYPTEDSLQKEG